MEESMLPDQPFYLWNGTTTTIARRSLGQDSYIVPESNSAMELWKYKYDPFNKYKWAYVNQDLELRPIPTL